MKYLLSTLHGSHLYGTSHSDSDTDYFSVVDLTTRKTHNKKNKHSKQVIERTPDGQVVDRTVVALSTFMHGCELGVPQYLEAMFCTDPIIDVFPDFRASYRVGTAVIPTYIRVIKSFSYNEKSDRLKKRRHALRLAANARSILGTGRFDPRLSPEQVVEFTELAEKTSDEVYEIAMNIIWT